MPVSETSHRYAVKALLEILGQSDSDADQDALDAARYRFVRDRGLIFFKETGKAVDDRIDAAMMAGN